MTFDEDCFKKLKMTHDGHGRISCETRDELKKYFDIEQVNRIKNKFFNVDFIDLSYVDFMKGLNDR